MNYPVESEELQDFYRSYIGKEPRPKTCNLLSAIAEVINEAYIEGQHNNMGKVKSE